MWVCVLKEYACILTEELIQYWVWQKHGNCVISSRSVSTSGFHVVIKQVPSARIPLRESVWTMWQGDWVQFKYTFCLCMTREDHGRHCGRRCDSACTILLRHLLPHYFIYIWRSAHPSSSSSSFLVGKAGIENVPYYTLSTSKEQQHLCNPANSNNYLNDSYYYVAEKNVPSRHTYGRA